MEITRKVLRETPPPLEALSYFREVLTPKQYSILMLYVIGDMNIKDIVKVLKIKKNSIYQAWRRIRTLVSQHLKQYYEDVYFSNDEPGRIIKISNKAKKAALLKRNQRLLKRRKQ